MAQGDFFVSFGSDLPEFLDNTQRQVAALDAAIKGIGGAFSQLAGIKPGDVKRLEELAKAVSGGGAINVDTQGLDSSITNLKNALAGELSKFSAALRAQPIPTATAKPASINVDLSGVEQSFKGIKPGELKRQANFLAAHVEKLREQTSATRASFLTARNEAAKTQRHAAALAVAMDEMNDRMVAAVSRINQIRPDIPPAPAQGPAAPGGGNPARAQAEATVAAEAEKSAQATRTKTKATEEAANKISEDTRALEQLMRARREELVILRAQSRFKDREKKGGNSRQQQDEFDDSIPKLASARKRQAEALEKVTAAQKKQFDEINKGTQSQARLDALGQAARELEAARKAEAAASRESATATKGKTKAKDQEAAPKQAETTAKAEVAGTALDTLAASAVEAANAVKEEAPKQGKALVDGVLQALEQLTLARRPSGEEQSAFDLAQRAAQSGARGLSPELNQALTGAVGLSQKQAMETAKSLDQILKGSIEVPSREFLAELTAIFQNLPQFLVAAQQQGIGPAALDAGDFERLVAPFPQGLPKEMAEALAQTLRGAYEERGQEGLEQGIKQALEDIARLLRTETDTRPGRADTASAIQAGGRAQQRDYGTFGATAESRAAVDQAVTTIGEFRARLQEASVETAKFVMQLQPDLNPLQDIPTPQMPQGLDDAGQREFRALVAEWERGKRVLQEVMVAYDQQKENMQGLSSREQEWAAVRRASLTAEEQRIAAAREEAQARREVIQAGEEALRRLSADPNFRSMGRVVPTLDADRDFPVGEDSVDFAKKVEEFNRKRSEWLQSIVDAIDLGEGPEQTQAFSQIDANLRKLYGELDALYTQRNATVEDELNSQKENLAGLKKSGASASVIANLEKEIAALEAQNEQNKREQALALQKRELGTQVPFSPVGAVNVERQRLRQQQTRGDEFTTEGIYGRPADLEKVLVDTQAAFEQLELLSRRYQDLESNKVRNLEETARRRAAAEAELARVVEDLESRRVNDNRAIQDPVIQPDKRLGYAGIGPMPEEARDYAKGQIQANKEASESASDYEKQLQSLRTEIDEQERTIARFKEVFKDLFPAPDARTGEGGRAGVTVERRPSGEREGLNKELRDVESRLRKFSEGLDETSQGLLDRRAGLARELSLPESKRTMTDVSGVPIDRDKIRSELVAVEEQLGKALLTPIRELEKRRGEITSNLAEGDRKIDRSGATLGPEDFTRAAAIVGEAINKAIVTILGQKFTALDRSELQSATTATTGTDAASTLQNFERRLEEVVVAVSQRAMDRLTNTTTTNVAGDVRAGAPGAETPGAGGETLNVRDGDSYGVLSKIEEGIRRLVECCHRMAEGLGVQAKTATAKQGVPGAGGNAPAQQLSMLDESFGRVQAAANEIKSAANESKGVAEQQKATASALVTAAQQYRASLEGKTGASFTRAEDMVLALVEGVGGVKPRKPNAAAREAGAAFGIEEGTQAFEDLKFVAQEATDALFAQGKAQALTTAETRASETAEQKRQGRLRQVNALNEEARNKLYPLVEELTKLERALEGSRDASERLALQERLRAKRAETRVAAVGQPGQIGGGVLPPGGTSAGVAQRLVGGQAAFDEAGQQAGTDFINGFRGVAGRQGAFSFIDRTLQTSVQFFIRSIASTLTFGLQRQLRELIGIGLETEATFIRVSSAMEATGRSAAGLRGEITRISTSLGVSLQELYEITARLTGVFEDPADVVRATESIALLEIISQGQLNSIEGYRALSAIQNTFWKDLESQGIRGEDAFEFINDATVAMQDLTGVNIEDLLEGAASLGAVTQPLNLGLLETQALVGKVAQTIGQTGTATAEQLGRIFANINDAKFQDQLLRLGVATQDDLLERDFKKIFENIADADLSDAETRNLADLVGGDRQFRAAMALFSQASEIVDTYTAATDSAGRAEERRTELMAELANQLGILGTNIENIVAAFVRSGLLNVLALVVAALNPILQLLNQVLTGLNEMADQYALFGFIRAVTGLAIGLGAVLLVAKALRNELATAFNLGSVKGATQAAAAAANASTATAAVAGTAGTARVGGLAGFMSRRGVEKVEVANVKELGKALRFRGLAGQAGVSPLDFVKNQLPEFQKRGIGQGPVGLDARAIPTLPRAILDRTTGRIEKMGKSLDGVGRNLTTTSASLTVLGKQSVIATYATRATGASTGLLGRALLRLSTILQATAVTATSWTKDWLTRWGSFVGGAAIGLAAIVMLGKGITDLGKALRDEAKEIFEFQYGGGREESEEDDPREIERNRVQQLKENARVDFAPGGFGDIFGDAFRNLGNFLTYSFKNPTSLIPGLGKQGFADAAAGQLEGEVQGRLDGLLQDMSAVNRITDPAERNARAQEVLAELKDGAESLFDEDMTEQQMASLLEQLNGLEDLGTAQVRASQQILDGIADANRLTVGQIEKTLAGLSTIQGLPPGMASKFADSLALLFESQGMPESTLSDLRKLASSGDYSTRMSVTRDLLERAESNARANLKALNDANAPADEIAKAEQALSTAITQYASFEAEAIQSAIARAQSLAQLAQFQGGSGANELRAAARAARRAMNLADEGSPEQAAAELQALDLDRQALEAGNSVANMADELAGAVSRDTMVKVTSQLDVAKRNLESAQDSGLYTAEQLHQMVMEVESLEQQVADQENQIAQAYNSLAQARTRNPMTKAILAQRFALEQLARGRRLGLGEAEIANLAAAEAQAADAVQDQRWADRDALAALTGARITNVMSGLADGVREATVQLNRARNNDMGAAAIYAAQQGLEDALRAQAEERRAIARASEDASISRIRNPLERARATAETASRRMREEASRYGRTSQQFVTAQTEFDNATKEIAEIQRSIAAAQRQFGITVAEVAQLDVQAARLRYADARQNHSEATSLYGAYSTEAEQSRAAEEQARGALRDAILQDATDRIDWQLSMEEITERQALAAYQNILNTYDLTEKQRRDIMLKMKQLQDSINDGLEGQFNLGEIRVPTPYEVRRSMGLDGIQDSINQVVTDFASMFGAAARSVSSASLGTNYGSSGGTSIANNNSETTILVNGADIAEVRRILNQILGPSAIGQVTASTSGSRRL